MSRKENFTSEEDISIVTHWLNTSEDSALGTGRAKPAMWEVVLENFNKDLKYTTMVRTPATLASRWAKIQTACNHYHFVLNNTERTNQSGSNQSYKDDQSRKIYKAKYGGNFKYEHVYPILKTHPKWLDWLERTGEKSKTNKRDTKIASCSQYVNEEVGTGSSTPTTPLSTIHLSDDVDVCNDEGRHVREDRPQGQKATKLKRNLGASYGDKLTSVLEEYSERMKEQKTEMVKDREYKIQNLATKQDMLNMFSEKRVDRAREVQARLREKELKALERERRQDEEDMRMSFEGLSDIAVEFWRKKQEAILAKWKHRDMFGGIPTQPPHAPQFGYHPTSYYSGGIHPPTQFQYQYGGGSSPFVSHGPPPYRPLPEDDGIPPYRPLPEDDGISPYRPLPEDDGIPPYRPLPEDDGIP